MLLTKKKKKRCDEMRYLTPAPIFNYGSLHFLFTSTRRTNVCSACLMRHVGCFLCHSTALSYNCLSLYIFLFSSSFLHFSFVLFSLSIFVFSSSFLFHTTSVSLSIFLVSFHLSSFFYLSFVLLSLFVFCFCPMLSALSLF